MCAVSESTCLNQRTTRPGPRKLRGAGPLEHGVTSEAGRDELTLRGPDHCKTMWRGGSRQEGLERQGPRRHTWVPQRWGKILPDRLWKPGGAELLVSPPQIHKTAQTFFKGLWGSEGRGGGRGRACRPPGGPHHFPHSRQPSVAPEPGRKQEVGNSRDRGQRPGWDVGSDGGAHSSRPGVKQTDTLTERSGGHPRPPPLPPAREHTRGSTPREWGAAQPVPPGEGP